MQTSLYNLLVQDISVDYESNREMSTFVKLIYVSVNELNNARNKSNDVNIIYMKYIEDLLIESVHTFLYF